MADLNYIDRDMETKIVGQDSTGNSVNYVSADANGNMFVKDYSDGPVSPGTAAPVSSLIGGQFNTALPTLTNTQQSAIQLDSSGRLIIRPLTSADVVSAVQSGTWTTGRTWTLASGTDSVSAIQGTSPWVVSGTVTANQGTANATPWNINVADFGGSVVVTGTGASGAGIPRVTVSNDSNILATQSGTWTVQPGNTANTTAWFVEDNSLGTVAAGTAGTQSSLAGGVFNTSLPTLTTGQQSAIQLDSSGRLIVSPTTQGILAEDHNYGTVGANTLRTASQIGNATGAGDFNAGATGAQTLRVSANQGSPGTAANAWFEKITDGTNTAAVKAASTAAVATDPALVVAISPNNTVAVTQSTSPWVTKDQSDGPVTPGTVASFSQLVGGQYNSTLPTLTNTQQSAIQLDSSGRLITVLGTSLPSGSATIGAVTQASGPWTQNLTQVGGSAIALGQTTMSASFPVTIASNQSALPVSQSGTWTTGRTWTLASGTDSVSVVQSTSPWVVSSTPANLGYDTNWGTVGATTLRTASIIGNQSGLANFGAGTTGAQTLRVAANTYDGFGNAITSASNGNAGQQLLNVQVPNTTVAPVALNALNAFVSIAMAGLQTVGFQLAAGTFIGTVTPQCSIDGGTNWVICSFLNPATGGISNSFTFTTSNTLTILGIVPVSGSTNVRVIVTAYTSGTASSILSASEALSSTSQSGFIDGSGTITALNQTVIAVTAGYGSSFFNITGTWVGTITFQANNGDGVWGNIYVYLSSTGSYTSSSTTVNSTAQLNCAGYYQVRAIATAWTSGTATVSWNAAAYPHQLQIYNSNSPLNVLTNAYTLDGNGNIIGSSTQTGASLYTIKPDSSTTGTLGALNAILNLPINNVSSVYALISGTWVGTIQFQGSVNGSTFVPLEAVQGGPTNAYSTTGFTTNGGVRIAFPAGFTSIQAVMTAYTSGTATVIINSSAAPASLEVVQFNAANLNASIVGNIASGTADSGNGVKTSAVYNSTLPTFTNGQRADSQSDVNGAQLVSTKVPKTYSAPQTASVGTTSTLILAANANRKGLYLSNTTATQQISFGFNGNAAAYQYGLTLFPGEKFWMDEYSFSTGAIYAITSGSTTYIGIQEIT